MKIKRLLEFGSASVLAVSTILSIAIPTVSAAVQTCTWTGATDLKFSTATNWSGCNSLAPLTGDVIKFTTTTGAATNSSTGAVITNDLGVALGGVIITSDGTSQSNLYFISALTLADNAIVDNQEPRNNTRTSLYLGSTYSSKADLIGQGNLTMQGSSIGYKSVKVIGTLILSGGAIGYLDLGAGDSVGGLTVRKDSEVTFSATNPAESLSLPITLGGGTGTNPASVGFEAICGTAPGMFSCQYSPATWTVSSPVTLLSDSYFNPGPSATVNYTGAISGAGFSLRIDPTATGTLNINPSSNNSNTVTGGQQQVATTISYNDSLPNIDVVVGKLVSATLDGVRGRVEVTDGGILYGTGTASALYVNKGGTVAPGHSPGCMNTSTLGLAGTYKVDIGGTDPCTGYDQLKVTGTVDLTGSTLDATLFNGFVPKVGQSFTIINNDVADAVTGTFTGVAEGGTYTNQGVTYTVTYKGGDGNDVVLTVKVVDASATPKKPDTGFALVAAHPLASFTASTLAALALLMLARRTNFKTKQ